MHGYSYVYILESLAANVGYYVSLTDDLSARLRKNNTGGVPHTAMAQPWRIKPPWPFAIAAKPRILSAT